MSKPVCVKIRPHLVSFLFEELQGETQAVYGEKKVKLACISRSSYIGQMIETFTKIAPETNKSPRISSYSVFLTITDNKENVGLFHTKHNKTHKALELPEHYVFLINEFLENIFRISLVEFVKGYADGSKLHRAVEAAVNKFMLDHDLYATELDPASLKALYYKTIKKKHSLVRLQNQIGNRSYYFNALKPCHS